MALLPEGWEFEVAIPTKHPKKEHVYPTCYKVDLGNRTLKLAIELDGNTHYGKRYLLDQKKDTLLQSLGWKVLRIKNVKALEMCTICKSQGILLTSLLEF